MLQQKMDLLFKKPHYHVSTIRIAQYELMVKESRMLNVPQSDPRPIASEDIFIVIVLLIRNKSTNTRGRVISFGQTLGSTRRFIGCQSGFKLDKNIK